MSKYRFRFRFFSSALAMAALLFGMLALVYWRELSSLRAVWATKSNTLLGLQREILAKDLAAVHSDIQFLARQPATVDFVSDGMQLPAGLAEQLLQFSAAKKIYDQIRVIGNEGFEHIRINYWQGVPERVDRPLLQFKGDRYYIEQAQRLNRGEVYVSPIDLNQEQGEIQLPIKPMIRFVAPVFDRAGTRKGWIVLNFLGQQLLQQLRDAALSFPGQSMLVNAQGEYVLAPNPEHSWGWMLGHTHRFSNQFPEAWQRIARRDPGPLADRGGWFAYSRFDPAGEIGGTASLDAANQLFLVSHVSREDLSAELRPLRNSLLAFWLAMLAPLSLLAYYLARTVEIRQRQAEAIRQSEQRLRQLSSQLMNAQELERKKVARDLHDDFGQQITAIIIDLERARGKVSDGASLELIDRLIGDARHMLENMHQIVRNLRPLELDDLSLSDAIASLAAEFEARQGLQIALDLDGIDTLQPSPRIKENVFRLVQESLSNVAAHAGTTQVAVHLAAENRGLALRVSDRGRGFHARQTNNGFGLLGMQERAELLGGRFAILTEIEQGTTIDVWIPCDEPGLSDTPG